MRSEQVVIRASFLVLNLDPIHVFLQELPHKLDSLVFFAVMDKIFHSDEVDGLVVFVPDKSQPLSHLGLHSDNINLLLHEVLSAVAK